MVEFTEFPKVARLRREVVITEKLDGTNAAVVVTDEGEVFAQSRTLMITPQTDNHGFANWVYANAKALAEQLGAGVHFGEWWGMGIQRKYNLTQKRFSLFNVHMWHTESPDYQCVEAPLCFVVPTIAMLDKFDTNLIDKALADLKVHGSYASEGFMNPEGIVIFHSQNSALFKVTYEYDETGKGDRAREYEKKK